MKAKTEHRQEDAKSSSKKENKEGTCSTMATRSGKKEESMRIWMEGGKKEKEETKEFTKLVTKGLSSFSFRRNRSEKLSV